MDGFVQTRFTIVGTAPRGPGTGVDHVRSQRIEGEELRGASQIEHAPRVASIMGDVSPRHVTGDQDFVGIVRIDGAVEHGAAAPRTDHGEFARLDPLAHHADCGCAPCEDYHVMFQMDGVDFHGSVHNRFIIVVGSRQHNSAIDASRSEYWTW